MKKSVLFALVFIALFISINVFAFDEGEYISIGKYNGEEIIWRVVKESEGDTFLISDKILCFKPFDKTYGNWGNSALRSWLNSSEDTVTYKTAPEGGSITANEYKNEKGFLNSENFTSEELSALSDVERYAVINENFVAIGTEGSENHIFSRTPKNAVQNYDAAYKGKYTDKIFLPSVNEIEKISNSYYTYGIEYHMTTPTEKAVELSGNNDMNSGKNWYYWLCDALSFGNRREHVRIATPNNTVSTIEAYNGLVGVRPMCALKIGNYTVSSGEGTYAKPYVVSSGEGIYINAPEKNLISGSEIDVTTYNSQLPEGSVVKKYINGVEAEKLIARNGENIIYSIVFDKNGNEIFKSNTITVSGIKYQEKKILLKRDFDDGKEAGYGFRTTNFTSDNGFLVDIDENRGKALKLISKSGKTPTAGLPTLNSSGKFIVKFDFMFTAGKTSLNLATFKVHKSESWISPITIMSGKITVNNVKTTAKEKTIQKNKWYTYNFCYDIDNSLITVYITEDGVNHILCYNAPSSAEIDYFSYGELTGTYNSSSSPNEVYFDNISVATCFDAPDDKYAVVTTKSKDITVGVYNPRGEAGKYYIISTLWSQNKLLDVKKREVSFSENELEKSVNMTMSKTGTYKTFIFDENLITINTFK